MVLDIYMVASRSHRGLGWLVDNNYNNEIKCHHMHIVYMTELYKDNNDVKRNQHVYYRLFYTGYTCNSYHVH